MKLEQNWLQHLSASLFSILYSYVLRESELLLFWEAIQAGTVILSTFRVINMLSVFHSDANMLDLSPTCYRELAIANVLS